MEESRYIHKSHNVTVLIYPNSSKPWSICGWFSDKTDRGHIIWLYRCFRYTQSQVKSGKTHKAAKQES
ncbi:MAG: hypothetical protein O7C56_06655, partial [Rickettsia endosymbiont of Ixodes persulcatus]|nr:hypothetical protein [Rickettsia endosymbiont of Ixodes persulcatus]